MSHSYTVSERYCGRWVERRGIIGAILTPCCNRPWDEKPPKGMTQQQITDEEVLRGWWG
ncbi:MAG: hypothetical protein ACE5JU_18855 [Candidatus Binatia bacterium]